MSALFVSILVANFERFKPPASLEFINWNDVRYVPVFLFLQNIISRPPETTSLPTRERPKNYGANRQPLAISHTFCGSTQVVTNKIGRKSHKQQSRPTDELQTQLSGHFPPFTPFRKQ